MSLRAFCNRSFARLFAFSLDSSRLRRECPYTRLHRFVVLTLKGLEERFQNDLGAVAGDGHADLLANRLLGSAEKKSSGNV